MSHDVIVVGAGIVGIACAWALARDGARVLIVDRRSPGGGATAAGMGHLVVLDDSPAQLALTSYAVSCWNALAHQAPARVEWSHTGTLWLARNDEELATARRRARVLVECGVEAEVLDARQSREAEPHLSESVIGALRVPGDRVLYPPAAATWLLALAGELGVEMRPGVDVHAIEDGRVVHRDGTLEADAVIDAAGTAALHLLGEHSPPDRMRPRKGHLLITDRHPGLLRHQLVELGYLASAHGHDDFSVAFNLQPRSTGQLLLGSSREYEAEGDAVDWAVLRRMVQRAAEFFPAIAGCQATRAWTGFRAATDDGLPLIGRVEGTSKLWLAAGHEGLGITTSLATGMMIADLMAGRDPALDPRPFAPGRSQRRRASA